MVAANDNNGDVDMILLMKLSYSGKCSRLGVSFVCTLDENICAPMFIY